MRWQLAAVGLLLASGCATPHSEPEQAPLPAQPANQPPAGFGTLRQDQFTIELRSGPVQVRVTPLDESVLRLAAPDTYRRLSGLAAQQRAALRSESTPGQQEPVLFLVTFFSREAGVRFQPADLMVESSGRQFRAAAITGITPGWGEQRLRAQESESAIYAFESGINLEQPLTIRYGSEASDQWRSIIPLLQEERSRALARAAAQ